MYVKWTEEIAKQVVEDAKFFLLPIEKCKRRDKLWEGLLITKNPGISGFENPHTFKMTYVAKIKN